MTHHAYEPGRFDFKEVLSNKDDPHLTANIAKAVCSMANADGGFLVFGIRDRLAGDGGDIDSRIVGIPVGHDHAKDFGQKIGGIHPEVHFESVPRPILLEGNSTRCVFVVYVPQSARRPHMLSHQDRGTFYIRGDGGSARPMSYFEVREQMLRSEELVQQVSLVRMKLAQWEEQCRDIMELDARGLRSYYGRFDTGAFEVLLSTVVVVLASDRELLLTLLRASSKAQEQNRRLDRWHHNDYDGHRLQTDTPESTKWRDEVHAEADRLYFMCDECELRLQDHFGPLTGISGQPALSEDGGPKSSTRSSKRES